MQICPGKLLIGINDSKELCHLHLTNPIDKELLLAATKLAEEQCLSRINTLKARVEEVKAKREVPVYKRPTGPRKTGTELNLAEVSKLLSDKESSEKRRSQKSLAHVPSKIMQEDVNIAEKMCII